MTRQERGDRTPPAGSARDIVLHAVGRVESPLRTRAEAPKQNDEGAPPAILVFDDAVADALLGVRPGGAMMLLTWLDRAERDVLRVHPRGDPDRPLTGVFATRSPARPNPIGLHRVEVTAVEGTRVHVHALEALDGTPILDMKPVLGGDAGER